MLQCLSRCSSPATKAPMPPLNEPNDTTPSNTNNRSFLVNLSARALGSIGFGLSILAIWLRWLVPSTKLEALAPALFPATQVPHRSRRQSSLPAPSGPSIPIMINNSPSNSHDSPNRLKHVYFVDTPLSERNSPVTEQSPEVSNQDISGVLSTPPDSSVPSSSTANYGLVKRDTYDESLAESDSSSRRSSLSCHLPRMIHPFGGKARDNVSHPEPITAIFARTSSLDDTKRVRRSSAGFTAPWSSRNRKTDPADTMVIKSVLPFRRPSSHKAVTSLKSPTSDSVQSPVMSYFSLKPHRRTSAPVPRTRTQPYDAPYFATPPIATDVTASPDIRKSPPMFHEASINSSRKQASAKRPGSNGEARGRQMNDQTEAAAGNGRTRTLPRRRSASESWINGRRAIQL
ncbi:hypothetical protein D9615_001207 [Tricholomella constricta]|uniref:Uncharacterized protein n=1 Tax=Tricholomella constricta TaxID=117010 RepID=A0A8H5HL47_9AGAR|nr:hypothetical protein D9615_001207 [Tricholomella constricta]